MARPIIICKECGKEKPHKAHGLCKSCYNRQCKRPLVICKDCGQEKPHCAKGLCGPCYMRQYQAEHWAEWNAYNRQWVKANPEKHREHNSQWREANPEKAREGCRRYRARKRNATIEPVDEAAVYVLNGRMCIYCGATENLTLDHIVPIARGGSHSEDNLVVACGSCNSSKNAKPLAAWLQTQPYSIAWVF